MQIRFLGTGAFATTRKCTSFIINDEILFDIGFGTMTTLRDSDIDADKISTIIISHFHPDHIGDIIYFLIRYWELSRQKTVKPLTIITPVGGKKVINNYKETMVCGNENNGGIDHLLEFFDETIANVVELKHGQYFEDKNIAVSAFEVIHGTAICNGYIVKINDETIGYSGDSCFCDSLANNIKNASTWVLDCGHLDERPHKRHTSLERIIHVAKDNIDKIFYAVHRGDYEIPALPTNLLCPNDGEIFSK